MSVNVSLSLRAKSYASFAELAPGYCHLFETASTQSVFHSRQWYDNYVATILGADHCLRVYGVEQNDAAATPRAMLAMQYHRRPHPVSRSYHLTGLANYYSCCFGPLLSETPAINVLIPCLMQAVCTTAPSWHVLDLKPLDVDSPVFNAIALALQDCGMIVQRYFCFGNWYLQVNGRSYHEYMATLPSSMRNTLRRKTKKWATLQNARMEIITGGDVLEAAIAAYEQVYSVSWKLPEPYPLFIRGLIRLCATMGWLRLGLAYLGSEPIAAQLWIVHGGIASIYKLAYNEQAAELSIGSILTARLMEYVIEIDKVHEVDYLSGDDPYKKTWMSHRRERWGIMAFNPWTVKGMLDMMKHVGGRTLKSMWHASEDTSNQPRSQSHHGADREG